MAQSNVIDLAARRKEVVATERVSVAEPKAKRRVASWRLTLALALYWLAEKILPEGGE